MMEDLRKNIQTAFLNHMSNQSSAEQEKQDLFAILNVALQEFVRLLNEVLNIVKDEMPKGSQIIGENNGVRFRDSTNEYYEGVLRFTMSAETGSVIIPPRQYQLPDSSEAFQTISSDHHFSIEIFSQRLPNIYNHHETSEKQKLYLAVPRSFEEPWTMTIKTCLPDNESNRGRTSFETPFVFSNTNQLVEYCVLQLIQAGKYKL
jgi:hypothetical protein